LEKEVLQVQLTFSRGSGHVGRISKEPTVKIQVTDDKVTTLYPEQIFAIASVDNVPLVRDTQRR